MTTAHLIGNLADAVEDLANDHKERMTRIDQRRQFIASKESEFLAAIDHIHAELTRLKETIKADFEALHSLEEKERSETGEDLEDEEPERPPAKPATVHERGDGRFEEMFGVKPRAIE